VTPTYVIAVGGFGAAVAARLAADPEEPGQRVCEVAGSLPDGDRARFVGWLGDKVGGELEALLRAGATRPAAADSMDHESRGRLDLVLIADAEEAEPALLGAVVDTLSRVLADRFAVMFPPGTAADQRSVGLVVLLTVPAIDSERGRAAARVAQSFERWHLGGPPSPILNRIYLVPRQNEVMPLSADDVEREVYLFVQACYRSGLRDSDAIRRRLGPPRDPRRMLDCVAVAAADVEVERISEAFAWRSALAGLDRLAAQCDGRTAGSRGLSAPELDVIGWLAPLGSDRPGRELAAAATGPGAARLDEQVLACDVAEAEQLALAQKQVRDLVDSRLGSDDGLGNFRAVNQALALAAERLTPLAATPESWLPAVDEAAEAAELSAAAAAEAEAAAAAAAEKAAPARAASPAFVVVAGILLALVITAGAAAMAAVAGVRQGASAAGSGGGVKVTSQVAPEGAPLTKTLLIGLGVGLVVGFAWTFVARWFASRSKEAVDTHKATTPESARNRRTKAAVESSLALRRRRIARGALAIVEDERERLAALRAAVLEAGVFARKQLKELGVTPADEPSGDDFTRLFGAETPLHWSLLEAAALPRLWERSRAVRDDELWSARLLARAYVRGGHRDDLPFAEAGAWEAALREQHQLLADEGVFTWPDLGPVLTAQVRRFLAAVPQALRLGVRPLRSDGTPETLVLARELLVVVPPDGRATVERVLGDQAIPDAALLAGARRLSRVLVLRSAGEFDSTSIGAGSA